MIKHVNQVLEYCYGTNFTHLGYFHYFDFIGIFGNQAIGVRSILLLEQRRVVRHFVKQQECFGTAAIFDEMLCQRNQTGL